MSVRSTNHYTGTFGQYWPFRWCEVGTCLMLGLALIYFLPEMWILVYNLWLLIKVILYDKLLFLLECVNLQCIWNL